MQASIPQLPKLTAEELVVFNKLSQNPKLNVSDESIVAVIKSMGMERFPEDLLALLDDWEEFTVHLTSKLKNDEMDNLYAFCNSLVPSEGEGGAAEASKAEESTDATTSHVESKVDSDSDSDDEERVIIEHSDFEVIPMDLSHITLSTGSSPARTPAVRSPARSAASSFMSTRSAMD
eukprot:gene45813-56071_t